MADAESNLVPSEAADQVEVALEEQAAAEAKQGDKPQETKRKQKKNKKKR